MRKNCSSFCKVIFAIKGQSFSTCVHGHGNRDRTRTRASGGVGGGRGFRRGRFRTADGLLRNFRITHVDRHHKNKTAAKARVMRVFDEFGNAKKGKGRKARGQVNMLARVNQSICWHAELSFHLTVLFHLQ